MDRRKFLQTLTALAASSTALPSQALTNTSYSAATSALGASSGSSDPLFQIPETNNGLPQIGIIAIGSAGASILNAVVGRLPHLSRTIVIDTNPIALHRVIAGQKILVGNGKRYLNHPDLAEQLTKQVEQEIANAATGLDLVFVLAGMGGVTGSSISPIVAKTLTDLSILTVGCAIMPFEFEGYRCRHMAHSGTRALSNNVTTILPISNEILSLAQGENALASSVLDQIDLSFERVYRNITNPAAETGLIGVDFEDVRVVLNNGGRTAFGFGSSTGMDGAEIAIQKAIASPLLGQDQLSAATGILVSIEAGRNALKMHRINRVMNTLKRFTSANADIIFSATSTGQADRFSVSLLATGLPKV
jgi:cell division protein FtsZ